MGRSGAKATNGAGGGRARALVLVLAAVLGWAVVHERGSGWQAPCDRPTSSSDQPGRVLCSVGSLPSQPLPLGTSRALGLRVDLNRVTAHDLATLPGVGDRLARRIVEERRRRGGFRSCDQLSEVKGVGPAKLETLCAALEPPTR